MIELYFSTVKILAQRPTRISAVATILLITKTFTVKCYYRRIWTNTASVKQIIKINTSQKKKNKKKRKRKKSVKNNWSKKV